VDKVAWLQNLCHYLSESFNLYPKDHDLTRVIMRYLGSLLGRLEAKALLGKSIDLMLEKVDNLDEQERQGLAQGLGLCGNVHLDLVLPKITEFLAKASAKQKSGFFGSGDNPQKEQMKCTVAACYGFVAAYANPELILSRLDVHILHNLEPIMMTNQAAQV
jgi:hypothetical protein